MTKKIVITDNAEEYVLDLTELAELCGASQDFIVELVEYEVVMPHGRDQKQWQFTMIHVQKIRAVQRLQRDLELNLTGAALVLELQEELETLRAKTELLEKHILK